jgi:bifunctional non-homologous end joining protein LigD
MIAGRRVVVTGRIAGESRQTAEAKLREAGAIVQSEVGKNTDVLVTGAAVGATKLKKARDLGVLVVPWEQAFGTNPAIGVAPPPREPAPAVRQWAPMLAKAGDLPTDGDKWLYEVKWDGYRGIATVKDGAVTIQSRSGKSDLTERFPEIVGALSTLTDCVLDGELVAIDGNGDSTFETLHRSNGATRYIVFDVLEVQGHGVTGMTLQGRRELLEKVVEQGTYLAVSPAFNDGQELLDTVIERGLEGIVAKLRASRYVEGSRTEAWTRVKIRNEQEFLVAGWTPGEGARAGTIGALVLALIEDGEVVYVGKAGSGMTDADMPLLLSRMTERATSPLREIPKDLGRDVTWVEPVLVVQVAYQRWTEDSRLWHPSFKGIRDDKAAKDVTREAVIA